MGLRRDNRYRQKRGSLLVLTKQEQEARSDWQKAQGPHWHEAKAGPNGIVTGPRASFTMMGLTLYHWRDDGDGLKPVTDERETWKHTIGASSPSWHNVSRTDTTDKISRAKMARKAVIYRTKTGENYHD